MVTETTGASYASNQQQDDQTTMNKTVSGKRERTRLAIIHAAMNIIASKGLDAASIAELMHETGMARGTFYNYFQSREDVLQAVLEYVRKLLHEKIELHIPDNQPPEVIIACMMYGVMQYSLDHPAMGWVVVRLGGDNDWFSPYDFKSRQFPRADDAVLALIKKDTPLMIIHTYIEGSVNTLLRRVLKQHIGIQDAEQLLMLILRGLGADDSAIDSAITAAREFADFIHHNEGHNSVM